MLSSPEHASFNLTSCLCILHFSLQTPNSLCAFRGGCASHCALFTAGNAALGEEQAFRGGLGDGFQVLSEVCFRLLGGAGAKTSTQAGEVWLRQGITPSPPTGGEEQSSQVAGPCLPTCPTVPKALTMLPCSQQQHKQQLLRQRGLRAQI